MSAQDVVVALLAALALGWLFYRWWRSRRSGKTACASCPSGTPVPGVRPAPQPEILISIGDSGPPRPQAPPGR